MVCNQDGKNAIKCNDFAIKCNAWIGGNDPRRLRHQGRPTPGATPGSLLPVLPAAAAARCLLTLRLLASPYLTLFPTL